MTLLLLLRGSGGSPPPAPRVREMLVDAQAPVRQRRWRALRDHRLRTYYGHSPFHGTLGGPPVFVEGNAGLVFTVTADVDVASSSAVNASGSVPLTLDLTGGAGSEHAASGSIGLVFDVSAAASVAAAGAVNAEASIGLVFEVTASAVRGASAAGSASLELAPQAAATMAHAADGAVPLTMTPQAAASIGLIIMRLIAGLRIMPRYRADVDIAPEE